MWHRVDVLTDVSEERIASIFRVEGKIRKFADEDTVRTVTSRRYVPPKRRLTPHLHGATSQKNAFFILILSTQVCLDLPSGLFPSGFPPNILLEKYWNRKSKY
jgi:hypothetical protein